MTAAAARLERRSWYPSSNLRAIVMQIDTKK
jgi:hypothetical protein